MSRRSGRAIEAAKNAPEKREDSVEVSNRRMKELDRRLNNLESSNFGHEREAKQSIELGERDEVDERGRKKKKKTRHGAAKPKPFLQVLYEEGQLGKGHCWFPTYENAATAPTDAPRREFCAVCGYKKAYTCVRCAVPYCSTTCYRTHCETRCQKFVA
eukprot:TRINITY_DN13541_c0_g1_i1.p1 TRINITY_DN13541_c0_g1~~TRINITY_DN13541_c0_g1_i1.p1  ORF type:complete len:158 (-),score=13.46 TRINITY_DN13541_c0_g1_i1:315-788(-)